MADKPASIEFGRKIQPDDKPQDPSRRLVTKQLGAGIIGGIATIAGLNKMRWMDNVQNALSRFHVTPSANPDITNAHVAASPDSKAEATKTQEAKEKTRTERLNEILAIPLLNENGVDNVSKRSALETEYVKSCQSIEDIDYGLMCVVDYNARRMLLEKRYAIRETGVNGLRKLTPEQEKWVADNLLHKTESLLVAKEVFAMCTEAYMEMIPIVDILRYDLEIETPEAETALNMLISPGGMAALVMRETSGMLNLATGGRAIDNFNEGPQSQHKDSTKVLLKYLVPHLNKITGLNFIAENIAGSKWLKNGTEDDKTTSGGAIGGVQFMPWLAYHMIELFEKARKVDPKIKPFNPLDPMSSIRGAYLKLSEEVMTEYGKRYAYRVDDEEAIYYGLKAWNPLEDEVRYIESKDKSFRQSFEDTASWELATAA